MGGKIWPEFRFEFWRDFFFFYYYFFGRKISQHLRRHTFFYKLKLVIFSVKTFFFLFMNLQVAHKALHRDKAVTEKSSSIDMVTETDQEVEKLIISTLKQKFPAHWWVNKTKCVSFFRSIYNCVLQLVWYPLSFIGEESTSEVGGCELTDDPTWMIDPIDGTTNFVHRYNHWP